MRGALIAVWCLLPAAGLLWHLGPGQEWKRGDEAAARIAEAEAAVAAERWPDAAVAWAKALAALPKDEVDAQRRVRLEQAKTGLHVGQLPEVAPALDALLAEVQADPACDPAFVDEVRLAAGSASYYMTWLLRLEGAPREEWEAEVQAARQHYKLLAETATDQATRDARQADLAAAIRLARLELGELQGLPIPMP
jgi:hypothetical protein